MNAYIVVAAAISVLLGAIATTAHAEERIAKIDVARKSSAGPHSVPSYEFPIANAQPLARGIGPGEVLPAELDARTFLVYTTKEVNDLVNPAIQRIAELEQEVQLLKALAARLADANGTLQKRLEAVEYSPPEK